MEKKAGIAQYIPKDDPRDDMFQPDLSCYGRYHFPCNCCNNKKRPDDECRPCMHFYDP